MGIRERITNLLPARKQYMLGVPGSWGSGLQFTETQTPPSWGYQSYLKAYGEIGTLFACVNIISQATAKVKWHLYELDKNGEQEEITQHELVDLLNKINPFQSCYQFVYMATMYKLLVGESFWVMNFTGSKPSEIWLAPPQYMSVIPHPTKYISHYEFKRSGMVKAVPFTVDEVIHVKTPNPYNEYRGLSPAQALTVDLDTERYAARYQQKFFFNDASPGLVLEYPPENMPQADARKELVQEWEDRHKGFRNRGKVAFLWGAKANVITLSNKDMDYANLRKFNRDAIMAAYHVPPSKLGIVENVNRATALTGDYDFQNNCVHPELCELRESINKELVPFYGDNLYLDFENPVPEDETQSVTNASNLFKSRIITRNEARDLVGLEMLDTPDGEEFATEPVNTFGQLPGKEPMSETEPQKAKVKAILQSEPEREDYWKEYVSRAESYEAKFIHELQTMFLEQKQVAIDKLERSTTRDSILIDRKLLKQDYTRRANTILSQVMSGAIKNGHELLEPPNPHKDGGEIPQVLSQAALKWLKTRIGWAADQIGEETATRLAQILAEGYEQGLSIPDIANKIKAEFDFFSDIRAERIARTEIMQASAQGTIEGYKELGEDVISKVQFYTALDERTCVEECLPLHNEIFTLADSVGVITVHPNCRCVWLPVID